MSDQACRRSGGTRLHQAVAAVQELRRRATKTGWSAAACDPSRCVKHGSLPLPPLRELVARSPSCGQHPGPLTFGAFRTAPQKPRPPSPMALGIDRVESAGTDIEQQLAPFDCSLCSHLIAMSLVPSRVASSAPEALPFVVRVLEPDVQRRPSVGVACRQDRLSTAGTRGLRAADVVADNPGQRLERLRRSTGAMCP